MGTESVQIPMFVRASAGRQCDNAVLRQAQIIFLDENVSVHSSSFHTCNHVLSNLLVIDQELNAGGGGGGIGIL